MKRYLLLPLLLLAATSPAIAHADEVIIVHDGASWYDRYDSHYWSTPFAHTGGFGLGIGATSLVSGLTGKLYLAPVFAVQATAGWWYDQGPDVNVDLIFEMPRLVSNSAVSLNWNLGAGGAVGFATAHPYYDHTYATVGGLNGVAGIALQLKPVPFEFVLELRPTYIFGTRGTWDGFYFGAGTSVRFFFT